MSRFKKTDKLVNTNFLDSDEKDVEKNLNETNNFDSDFNNKNDIIKTTNETKDFQDSQTEKTENITKKREKSKIFKNILDKKKNKLSLKIEKTDIETDVKNSIDYINSTPNNDCEGEDDDTTGVTKTRKAIKKEKEDSSIHESHAKKTFNFLSYCKSFFKKFKKIKVVSLKFFKSIIKFFKSTIGFFKKVAKKINENKKVILFKSRVKKFSKKYLFPLYKFYYIQSYLLGVFVIRGIIKLVKSSEHEVVRVFKWFNSFIRFTIFKPVTAAIVFFEQMVFDFVDPFGDAADATGNAYEEIKDSAKLENSVFFNVIKRNLKICFIHYLKCFSNLLNHLAPVAAAVVLVFVIGKANNLTYAIEINYNGENIGYIQEEGVFSEAQKMMKNRVVFEVVDEKEKEKTENARQIASQMKSSEKTNDSNITDDMAVKSMVSPFENTTKFSEASPSVINSDVSISAVNEVKLVNAAATAAISTNIISQQSQGDPVEETNNTSTNDVKSDKDLEKIDTHFTLKIVDDEKIDDVDSLCNKLIGNLDDVIINATGLYIDNQFYGATKDGLAIDKMLQDIIAKYDDGTGTVAFNKAIDLKDGLYPTNVIRETDDFKSLINSKEQGKKEYTVVAGDAPLSIATKNNISYSELVSLNPDIEKNCFIGDIVLISSEKPFLPIKISRQETYDKVIPFETETTKSDLYNLGVSKVTQEGSNGLDTIVAEVSYLDGVEINREILKSSRISNPVTKKIVEGTKVNKPVYNNYSGSSSSAPITVDLPAYNGKFAWPTVGGRIVCGFYGYRGHGGVDIGRPTGTPTLASAPGVVVYSGWNSSGYGNLIIIDHGGGYRTYYAHNSSLTARVGQSVVQGQQIASVGQTGNAYGSHVHFEIQYNGKRLNPERYL